MATVTLPDGLPEGLVRIVHKPKRRKGTEQTEPQRIEHLLALPKRRDFTVAQIAEACGIPVEQFRKLLKFWADNPKVHGAVNSRVTEIMAHGRELTDEEPYETLRSADVDRLDLSDDQKELIPEYKHGK